MYPKKCNVAEKTSYSNAMEASIAISQIQATNTRHRKRKYREEPIRHYLCSYCGFYHLTSMPLAKPEQG